VRSLARRAALRRHGFALAWPRLPILLAAPLMAMPLLLGGLLGLLLLVVLLLLRWATAASRIARAVCR
jgi:hypothetical protein